MKEVNIECVKVQANTNLIMYLLFMLSPIYFVLLFRSAFINPQHQTRLCCPWLQNVLVLQTTSPAPSVILTYCFHSNKYNLCLTQGISSGSECSTFIRSTSGSICDWTKKCVWKLLIYNLDRAHFIKE